MKTVYANLIGLVMVAGVVTAGSYFTDVTSQYGPSQNTQINAAFNAIEDRIDGSAAVTMAPNKIYVGNNTSNKTEMAVAGDVTITQNGTTVTTAIGSGVIVNADVSATAAIAHTKLAAVAPGYVMVGNASSQAVAVAVSGDVTMSNAGAVAIASGAIVNADVNASAAIAHTKLAAVAPGYVMVGNASSQAVAVAVSGDITMANNGAVAIAAGAIVAADVNATGLSQIDANVTTTNTVYTPAFRGQVLIGGAGVGTNAVWIAKGVTTNDWVQVAP